MANVLKHIIGKETKIVVLEGDKVELDDFFSAQYKKALSITESIVKNQGGNTDKTAQVENYNNIISFIGERGSGKTSCMLTFANILEAQGKDELKNKNQSLSSDELSNKGFYQLPTIDPSFFAKEYNIIGAFIASIYNKFQELTQKNNNNSDDGVIQDFYNALSNAQRSFGKIYTEGKPGIDDMERLEQMSCRLKLKSEIKTLVDSFLCYISNRNDKKNATKLVLCIDDIDLNTETAVEMMEWIRKYLIQPNIIILFAIKLDQMVDLKRLELFTQYKVLIDQKRMSVSDVENMVEKYITKMIPLSHRIFMPDLYDIKNIRYQKVDSIQAHTNDASSQNESSQNLPILREIIVSEIFKKTGYAFLNSTLKTNLIVPCNLRETLSLLRLLGDMKSEQSEIDGNRLLFKEYLLNDCLRNNLSSESICLIDELLRVEDISEINVSVLNLLRIKFKKVFDSVEQSTAEKTDVEKEILYILDVLNYTYNVSMGDVLGLVNWLDNKDRLYEERYFLFILKAIYTMRLVDSIENVSNTNPTEYTNLLTHSSSELLNISEYNKLLGGQLFNPYLTNFIPNSLDTVCDVKINIRALFREFDFNKKEDCRMAEFLMLCIVGPIDRLNSNNRYYRRNPVVRYCESFSKRYKFAIFDIFSLLYNITDISHCYYRFFDLIGKEDWLKVVDNEDSLWKYILSDTDKLYDIEGDNIVPRNISNINMVFLNVDLYYDLWSHLEDKKRLSEKSGITNKINGFLKAIDMYVMPTISDQSVAKPFNCDMEILSQMANRSIHWNKLNYRLDSGVTPTFNDIFEQLFICKKRRLYSNFEAKFDLFADRWNGTIVNYISQAADESRDGKYIVFEKFAERLMEIDVNQDIAFINDPGIDNYEYLSSIILALYDKLGLNHS